MRTRVLALLPLLASSLLCAQSQYVVLTATNIVDASGKKLSQGNITFSPVDAYGNPVLPHLTSGGRMTGAMICFTVVDGAITGQCDGSSTLQLADVTQTQNPADFCYRDKITDTKRAQSWSPDRCGQPAYNAPWCTVTDGQTICNFDNYLPLAPSGTLTYSAATAAV